MSYVLHGYAVHWPSVEKVLREGATASDEERFRWRGPPLDALDRRFAPEIAAGAPTSRDALRSLMVGEPLGSSHGFVYAYVLEELIGVEGAILDNGAVSGVRHSGFFGDADRALLERGLTRPLFGRSLSGALPLALPAIDDFPAIGYLDASEMEALQSELSALRLDGLDASIAAAAREVIGWISDASYFGNSIATFYY